MKKTPKTKKPGGSVRQEFRRPLAMVRQCGSCCACCVVMQISDLDKLAGDRCVYLKSMPDRAGMCTIYDAPVQITDGSDENDFAGRDPDTNEVRKPAACHEFKCGWISNITPEALYPAKCGVMFHYSQGGDKLIARELWRGASRARLVEDYIATLSARGVPVIIIAPYMKGQEAERRIIRPAPGTNPAFEAELVRMAARHPEQFGFLGSPNEQNN